MSLHTEKAAPGATNTKSGKTEDRINPVSDSISKEVENFKKIDEKEIIRVLMVLLVLPRILEANPIFLK